MAAEGTVTIMMEISAAIRGRQRRAHCTHNNGLICNWAEGDDVCLHGAVQMKEIAKNECIRDSANELRMLGVVLCFDPLLFVFEMMGVCVHVRKKHFCAGEMDKS